jgi:glycosyltransferase involved in cell wall biosynthesis
LFLSEIVEPRMPMRSFGSGGVPAVAFYREMLINYNEPFILAHGEALARYDAWYVGMRRIQGLECAPDRTIVLNTGTRITGAAESLFKLLGVAPLSFLRAIRQARPTILHAFTGVSGAQALPLARRLGLPLFVTCTGYEATATERELRQYRYRGRVYLRRRDSLQRETYRFLAVSDFVRRRLVAQGFPEERTLVHYVGVDTNFFRADPAVKREPVVLFIGRLIATKGVAHLISAFAAASARVPAAELVIIGKGPLRAELEKQAEDLRVRVRFLGGLPADDIKNWMNRAMVLCTPSVPAPDGTVEALPAVCAEAQSMGLPIAAFASGGIPEGVLHGETGLLAAEKDEAALASNIERLLTDRTMWMAMSEAAMARARSRFDLRRQTRALEQMYDEARGLSLTRQPRS